MLEIKAKINSISYTPTLCKEMKSFDLEDLDEALEHSIFLLTYSSDVTYAVSQWVSPKRTRSYPYERVYNTYSYSGKRVTIIPVIKDEGIDGDRDYIQWDTISMMSLLQTYVVLVYYTAASKNNKYSNKITDQKISLPHLKNKFAELAAYKSDALHWNLEQAKTIMDMMKCALDSYATISQELKVIMHSRDQAEKRIESIKEDYSNFLAVSRTNAKRAQHRETQTVQPKEYVNSDEKAEITIENFLKGVYYFTADEARFLEDVLLIIEAKHSKNSGLPSHGDIIDGVMKMILFSNLEKVTINGRCYSHQAILKLTCNNGIKISKLTTKDKERLNLLMIEAKNNNFKVVLE